MTKKGTVDNTASNPSIPIYTNWTLPGSTTTAGAANLDGTTVDGFLLPSSTVSFGTADYTIALWAKFNRQGGELISNRKDSELSARQLADGPFVFSREHCVTSASLLLFLIRI